MLELPTIQQCQGFLVEINRGRELVGLEPLEFLDFDNARPDSITNCLSARNLYRADSNAEARSTLVRTDWVASPCVPLSSSIPKAVLDVTNVFDACSPDLVANADKAEADCRLAALRARMVEAGVVAP